MIYQPDKVAEMWDTWLYFHDGTHYLYYLHKSTGDKWDGMSVATSLDGAHFEEQGPIISKREDAEWLGTGSVWKADERFILNFSESREGVQAIFLAESKDLINWERLGDELRSDPDPRWYDDTKTGRWDCIWALPKPEGIGFYGYLTARPWNKSPGIPFDSVGMVESDDGLHWHAFIPPTFEWGDWPQMSLGEVGAIEKIGDRYYLMLGYGECLLGNRWVLSDLSDTRAGMYCFVAERPEGPYRPDIEAYRLLVSNGTYFSRFYRAANEVLVNHHSIEHWGADGESVWMAPLKKAIIDNAGHLRLGFWAGNESLKGIEQPIDLSQANRVYPTITPGAWTTTDRSIEADEPAAGGATLLHETFDFEQGIILEGEISAFPSDRPWSGIGLFVEHGGDSGSGTGILIQTRGRTEIGRMSKPSRGAFVPTHRFESRLKPGVRHDFRLMARKTMVELYLDEMMVLCHSLEVKPSGRLGLIHEGGRALFVNLRAWRMSLEK